MLRVSQTRREGYGIEDPERFSRFSVSMPGGSPDTGKSAELTLLQTIKSGRGTFKRVKCFVCDTDQRFVGV